MDFPGWKSRFRVRGIIRRPTLEVHVPISPTPSFLNQLRCLTHSLRRFGGAYRNAPVIATVGWDHVDHDLAKRMPWLAANNIELRWTPPAEFAAHNYFATTAARLKHQFRSDMVLLLDADTLVRRPLDPLINQAYRTQSLAGTIAHTTPLPTGRLEQVDWPGLFEICGLKALPLEYEHTGWGYFFGNPAHRFCPPYFNYGVIAAPARVVASIGQVFERHLYRLRATMGSYFDTQIALTMAIAQLSIPVIALPLRYNMPNHPPIEALHHTELNHATILHLLAETYFQRVETFASLESIEAFLHRTDLRLVSRMAQMVMQEIYPKLVAEEHSVAA